MNESDRPELRWLDQLRRIRLGWLFLAGSLLFGGWVFVSLARHHGWGEQSYVARFRTANALGIWPGVFVTISGYRVGTVQKVSLLPDGSVAVELGIRERYRRLIGPRTRAFRTQENLLGDPLIGLSPDITPAGTPQPRTNRLLPYDPGTDMASLLGELAQTRLHLDRTLQGMAGVVEKDLPSAIGSFNGALGDVRQLSGTIDRTLPPTAARVDTALADVSSLAKSVEKETAPTAAAARGTLEAYRRTGESVELTARQVEELLRDNRQVLTQTLREIAQLTATINRLLGALGGAFSLDGPGQRPTKNPPPKLEKEAGTSPPTPPIPREAGLPGPP